ncbi:hypothetical protein PC120_g26222 [Phytophthora cactorum]|nr:hypothetical protein PC120_g26222 [Phytophthora cactorum]
MVSILRASTAALACAGSEAMLTPNEYAYGDCCKLILSSYHLGHSGTINDTLASKEETFIGRGAQDFVNISCEVELLQTGTAFRAS